MKSINHEELKNLIKICYNKKVPLFIWGATGIGKSQTAREVTREIAKQKKLEFSEDGINEEGKFCLIDVRISQLDPSDLRGLPKIEGTTTKWLPPSWLPEKGEGMIFFDELNLAPPSIQASAYQLILDRKLGDYKLPKGYVVISAGNRIEDRANIFELPAPLSNRFAHIELGIPNIDNWSAWATSNNIDARITSFLHFKPSFLFRFDSDIKEKAFPTPRSWEYCSKLLEDVDSGQLETSHILVSSAVGEAVAIEFEAFLKLSRKIDPRKILEHPKEVKKIKEIDLKYSLLGTLSEFYKKDYKKDKRLLDKILQVAKYLEPEFAVLLVRFVKGVDETYFLKNVVIAPTWGEESEKYAKYLL